MSFSLTTINFQIKVPSPKRKTRTTCQGGGLSGATVGVEEPGSIKLQQLTTDTHTREKGNTVLH